MAELKVLIPYNFTGVDRKSLDFAIQAYGQEKEVKITLLHTYVSLPQIEPASNTVMSRLSSNMHYLRSELLEKEKEINQIKQYLMDGGFRDDQIDYDFKPRSKSVADEIIATAKTRGSKIIILSYRPHRITRAFIQSVHNKVISTLKDVTVCVVT